MPWSVASAPCSICELRFEERTWLGLDPRPPPQVVVGRPAPRQHLVVAQGVVGRPQPCQALVGAQVVVGLLQAQVVAQGAGVPPPPTSGPQP